MDIPQYKNQVPVILRRYCNLCAVVKLHSMISCSQDSVVEIMRNNDNNNCCITRSGHKVICILVLVISTTETWKKEGKTSKNKLINLLNNKSCRATQGLYLVSILSMTVAVYSLRYNSNQEEAVNLLTL